MPHDDESRVAGRLAAHDPDSPEVEIVPRSDADPAETDEWSGYAPNGDHGADVFVSTDQDEVFDPDGVFDVLENLAEADILSTVSPIEIPDDDDPAPDPVADPAIELAPEGETETAGGGPPRATGVNAVLERLQAADEAAASGAPVPLRASKKRLGEILVDMGLVTEEQIEGCLVRQ